MRTWRQARGRCASAERWVAVGWVSYFFDGGALRGGGVGILRAATIMRSTNWEMLRPSSRASRSNSALTSVLTLTLSTESRICSPLTYTIAAHRIDVVGGDCQQNRVRRNPGRRI
jgi:hypothetical protein